MQTIRTCLPLVLAAMLLETGAFGQTPHFEVASIRPTLSDTPDRAKIGIRIDGAQVRCTGLTLRDYIARAYNMEIYQISGPEWVTTLKFDISGKVPDDVKSPDIPAMLRSLLADRFHLSAHKESKEFPVYALIVGKGGTKLTESQPDPASDTAQALNVAAEGSAQGTTVRFGNGSYVAIEGDKLDAHKVQMSSFANVLGRFVDRPTVDMTGLKGTYDFAVPVTSDDFLAMMVRAGVNAGVTLPPMALSLLDKGPAESLFNGIEKLGLKLDPRKAPLEILVVDRMDKTPTEN